VSVLTRKDRGTAETGVNVQPQTVLSAHVSNRAQIVECAEHLPGQR
jgi:hypothetical protein